MAKNKSDNDVESDVEFVLMDKDGIEIQVHPTCVVAHKNSGWKIKTNE